MSNPLNTAEAQKVEDTGLVSGWGQVKPRLRLELPSGSRVLLQELEIPDLLGLGILDIVDQFSQELLPKPDPKKGKESAEKEFLADLTKNKDQFNSMLDVVDKIVASAVIEPKVTYVPPVKEGEPDPLLEEGKIYAHLIPIDDRMTIFEKAVAGMEDLFRSGEGQAEGVADVADGESVREDSE